MIERLHIENFQSHEASNFIFDPGVNAIVGPSDMGKSAVLRALRWALMNEPDGKAFRSHWGGDTIVKVSLEHGAGEASDITRTRTASKNLYRLDEHIPVDCHYDGTTVEFKAFGKKVPEEIAAAVNMCPVNWQAQLDPHFLLSENASQVARRLNEAVDLDIIDTAISQAEAEVRDTTAKLRAAEEAVKKAQESLKGFDYLEDLERDAQDLQDDEARRLQVEENQRLLDTIVTALTPLEWKRDKAKRQADALDDLKILELDVEKREALEDRIRRLKDIGKQITVTAAKAKAGRGATEAIDALDEMAKLMTKNAWAHGQIDALKTLEVGIFGAEQIVERKLKLVAFYENKINELAPDGLCPTCGAALED